MIWFVMSDVINFVNGYIKGVVVVQSCDGMNGIINGLVYINGYVGQYFNMNGVDSFVVRFNS